MNYTIEAIATTIAKIEIDQTTGEQISFMSDYSDLNDNIISVTYDIVDMYGDYVNSEPIATFAEAKALQEKTNLQNFS